MEDSPLLATSQVPMHFSAPDQMSNKVSSRSIQISLFQLTDFLTNLIIVDIEAQIDAWTDFVQTTVVPAATRVFDMIAGKIQCDRISFSMSLGDLKKSLTALDAHLALRNFLVGHSMTIADALLVSTLARCFELVVDKKTRDSSLKNLSRYTMLILKMGPFARVFGQVSFCKDMTQPDYNAEKPKAAAKEQPKQQQKQKQEGKQKDGKKGQAAAGEEEKK